MASRAPTQADERTPPALEADDVQLRFGGIRALDGLSLRVDGGICAVVGPNGAGKSTLFNCVSGLYRPQRGAVRVNGTDVLGLPPHRISALGVGRTFQNLALFPRLSVIENVLLGAYQRHADGLVACALHLRRQRRHERRLRAEAYEVLERLELADLAEHDASGLPFSVLKRVEIARALVNGPRLLLLDEPAAGLPHGQVDELGGYISAVRRDFDVAIVLVEHHMGLVMSISDRVIVLNLGRCIAAGTADEVSADPTVIEAYLGAAR
ncbi:ABC transporter ATP-binding protein [Jiangella alba]|uniref:Amino acid/amide ABC transporter ATP-binding protein 1, HAAT family n=1 Tax=Jiangella alba TaxID=561176 RepID=A0A1H5K0K8_9ACTN|nr:ABC transporter ATP-binding protein [Jiangella alba]SEE58346.1 amino acid/amide ABC transporter ATP-binding protein 1, HAAT family [Jiangella alba]